MSYTIGKLAAAAGVNVESIRYYQRMQLIVEPPKPAQGYRHYPASYVARIRFIKRAQPLGFTLKEIHELLALGDDRSAADGQPQTGQGGGTSLRPAGHA